MGSPVAMRTGMHRNQEHFRGCLLGGAVGDALGAAVEFMSLDQIRSTFGAEGVRELVPAYGRVGAITDDTQMTLFTAEGLLRAEVRGRGKGVCHVPSVVHHAYIRWLHTQRERSAHIWSAEEMDGWLYSLPELHHRRAPGNTCLAALRSADMGALDRRLNDSKGCGTVMRIAPVGLVRSHDPFLLGCEIAAITHGHPSGILAAGFLAEMIRRIVEGAPLRAAIDESLPRLCREPDSDEVVEAVLAAVRRAESSSPSPEVVEELGGGWVSEEALAISLYCALVHEEDFEAAVCLAVNHGGDSDSTGAITGNLLGLLHGQRAIPSHWLDEVELREEIAAIADDLITEFDDSSEWWDRYPGW